jgi:hypothetical protein
LLAPTSDINKFPNIRRATADGAPPLNKICAWPRWQHDTAIADARTVKIESGHFMAEEAPAMQV